MDHNDEYLVYLNSVAGVMQAALIAKQILVTEDRKAVALAIGDTHRREAGRDVLTRASLAKAIDEALGLGGEAKKKG